MNYKKALKDFEKFLSPDGLENARAIIDGIFDSGLKDEELRYVDESTVIIRKETYVLEPDGQGGFKFQGEVGPQMAYVAAYFIFTPDFTRDGPLLKNGEPHVEYMELVEGLQRKREQDILGQKDIEADREIQSEEKPAKETKDAPSEPAKSKRGRKPKTDNQGKDEEVEPVTPVVVENIEPQSLRHRQSQPTAEDILNKIRGIEVPRELIQLVITDDGSTLELLPWVETLGILQNAVPTFSVTKAEVTYGHGQVVVTVVGEIPTIDGPLKMTGIGIAGTIGGENLDPSRPAPVYLAHASAFNRMAMMFGLRREVWSHRSATETAHSFGAVKPAPAIAPVPAPVPSAYNRPKPDGPAESQIGTPAVESVEAPKATGTDEVYVPSKSSTSRFGFGRK